jgi:imidazolonepropionase-like amidohydrolase
MRLELVKLWKWSLAIGFLTASVALAQDARLTAVLFENVGIFDGKSSALSAPSNVLVRGNKIERVSTAPIPIDRRASAQIIRGGGRTLMPGLIDVHTHLMFNTLPNALLLSADPNYLQFRAGASAKDFLLAGFTSARDLSGAAFGMRRAIDEGLLVGPRIWPSGTMISQTSGHADFRALNQLPSSVVREPHPGVRFGYVTTADGVPAMLTAVREQLMQGASQIKLAAGGGVSSNYDPIDVTEYSLEEIKAAVGAAEDWGTYVAVHGYTPRAVRRAPSD